MYHPTTRVLTLLELLQSRGRFSGAELAQRLEVDGRTIRRYVGILQELGVPVESVPGRAGGYQLRPGFKLPPLMFTEEEALSLTLGLLLARRLLVVQSTPAIEGALAKIDRVMPDSVRGRVQAVQGVLSFTFEQGADQLSDPGTLLAVSSASQRNQRVWMRYRGTGVEQTRRVVDPYGVVHHHGRWYVAGWCHLRQDIRTFRLDRIAELQALDEDFVRPAAFDCAAYVVRSLAASWTGWQIEVLLKVSEPEARRRIPTDFGLLEPVRKGVLLRTQADDLDWVARRLVNFGCPFSVRHPPELGDALRTLAGRLRRSAGRRKQLTAA